MRKPVVFAATALLLGIAYALITPPFEVADEVGHYWRASSIAYGYINTPRPLMPQGFRMIVSTLLMSDRTQHMTADRMQRARAVMLQPQMLAPLHGYALYSPAAYLPQIAAGLVARVARLPPFYAFFLGRLATLIVAVFVIAVAGEIAASLRDHLHVAALLPMSLSLFGSWSADAMTIAAAFLTSALIVASRTRELLPSAVWLSLCKAPYGAIAFLSRRPVVIAAVLAGSALSIWMTMSAATASPRPNMPIDAHAQVRYMLDHPIHFAGVIVGDIRFDYLKMMVGRFGLADVSPPAAVTWVLLLLLAAVGVMNGPSLSARMRLAICAISAAIVVAIYIYLYVTSSIAGGDTIEGTHGRYILPLLPLILCLFRVPRLRFALPHSVVMGVTAAANVVCLVVLVRRYW